MVLEYVIKILEKEPQKRGSLFGRLMQDLFVALGYDEIRLNIPKTGREVDVKGIHRTEGSRVVAECKATKKKTGGEIINKFVGVLDAERRGNNGERNTKGYFISLSGFTESAIEQEEEFEEKRLVLLNGAQVINELIVGRIITAPEKAMERAGRCAAELPGDLLPEDNLVLLAHKLGWIWLIYFNQNRKRTHFALVHADGSPLATGLADEITTAAGLQGVKLKGLEYLAPTDELIPQEERIFAGQERYFEYIGVECGEITLEGLPADQEVGAKRLKLENIFVPLYLEDVKDYPFQAPLFSKEPEKGEEPAERYSVGDVISKYSRVAILAAPGGGKTTLLKRIAIAYSARERSELIDDVLPERRWLPLFIRCRQLGSHAKSPLSEIIKQIPIRAEMPTELAGPFLKLVNKELISGNVLLLVDGLDEISGISDRISFVKQLRTFLAIYPRVSVIVTSREAGFRIVGAALCTYCTPFKVADFNEDDILRLTVAWHKEVVGDKPEVLREAEKLAKTIIDTDRVKQLAKNPLLLTTLLLVKRWVGQLPTKRTVLYGKAIEVLLMTWNVEGYESIDPEEAIPQLSFLAFTMMKEGIQTISEPRLSQTLKSARSQMPEILGFPSLSVSQFVRRVELRSSILVMSGHALEGGKLTPLYEFRHLTFQEYLAAKALSEGYYPDRKKEDCLLGVLEPFLSNEQWKEVIPLAAVLAGREVRPLIEYLLERTKPIEKDDYLNYSYNYPAVLLCQCIADEVQVTPGLLKESFEYVGRRKFNVGSVITSLYRSKYGGVFLETVKEVFSGAEKDLLPLGSTIAAATLDKMGYERGVPLNSLNLDSIMGLARSRTPVDSATGFLIIMDLAFRSRSPFRESKLSSNDIEIFNDFRALVIEALDSSDLIVIFTACWALAWLDGLGSWRLCDNLSVLNRLIEIWREVPSEEVQYVAAWAITELPLVSRTEYKLKDIDRGLYDFLKALPFEELRESRLDNVKIQASLIVSYYAYGPWDGNELASLIGTYYDSFSYPTTRNAEIILKDLGDAGLKIMAEIREKKPAYSDTRIRRKRRPTKKS